jgi:hypothetical protein
MSTGTLVKITAGTASEICAHVSLNDEAEALLRHGMSPQEFLIALIDSKRYVDAIDFMAHALPVREGIWWGCLCMQHIFGDNLPSPDRAAAAAAIQWLMQPTEENRAAAVAPAEAAGILSAAGALARAAAYTGGSIAPPGLPFKAPEPFAPQQSVARAVKIASIKTQPVKIAAMQRSFLDLGMEVAEGRLT